MDVQCESCKTKQAIADPGDDGWYGTGFGSERLTWVCGECGSTHHIDREVTSDA